MPFEKERLGLDMFGQNTVTDFDREGNFPTSLYPEVPLPSLDHGQQQFRKPSVADIGYRLAALEYLLFWPGGKPCETLLP